MECLAKTVIAKALEELGYAETGTNITKYASDFDNLYPNFYNYKKQGVEWCDMFFDWIMVTCFGEENALRLTCQPKKSAGAGVIYSYGYYKKKNQVGKDPKIGAQIFFGKSESTLSHTGLVVDIQGDTVYTIEGNKNNKVSACMYKKGDSKIYGYGYPAYDEEETPTAVGDTVYTVKRGDTLSKIAKAYGTTVAKIKAVNPDIKDVNLIRVGQKVIIPSSKASTPTVKQYKVIAPSGVYIRKGPGKQYATNGAYVFGSIVDVVAIEGAWAKLTSGYYVSADWIEEV